MNRIAAILLFVACSQTANAFPTYATGGFRGAELMTRDEVKAHVSHLLSVKTMDECEAYMGSHEQELQRRAALQQVVLPEKSGDPCKVMRFLGRIH